ncbi:hypothetical protein B5808_09755 [Cnuibacter physcomitrellae]|uniref:Uncharacterized protein n=1 Tax=Cnuibacter physcomitrellae TaxID=1619308 RepID=A0A1X9LJU0_9MICO|nr:hypothetical protein [Cnuibacter physcomitrellae]ARJ05475.1 hypothetical protein B5808_09755 [Cnuibacter physcomitrellae]
MHVDQRARLLAAVVPGLARGRRRSTVQLVHLHRLAVRTEARVHRAVDADADHLLEVVAVERGRGAAGHGTIIVGCRNA